MLFTNWPYSHGNQSPYKEENPFNIVFLTCVMLYDQTFSLLSPEIPSHYSRQPISSRDSACVSASKTSAKWGWKRRKSLSRLDLKCIKDVKLLRNTTAGTLWKKKKKCMIYCAWRSSFFMVIYGVIGKHKHAHCSLCGWLLEGWLEVIALGWGPAPFTFSSANWAVRCLRRSAFGPERI